MASDSFISITISHRGKIHPLVLPSDSTLLALQTELEALTSISLPQQKLLFKGKKITNDDSRDGPLTLEQAGIKDGMKVQVLGPTAQELGSLREAEAEKEKRERILRERALKKPVQVRSTSKQTTESLQYTFHRLQALPHLPDPPAAHAFLERLSNDPAILHVMRVHRFSVGLLTELAPHEHPGLLGLNVNKGEAIKLRIRTDAYDGFRPYREVRRCLCHELTHNVWGPHDDNFKELNSRLNREVLEHEQRALQGTHRLGGSEDVYEPAAEGEAYDLLGRGSYTLGGRRHGDEQESSEERRARILEAVMQRLSKEEEELEHSCGTET